MAEAKKAFEVYFAPNGVVCGVRKLESINDPPNALTTFYIPFNGKMLVFNGEAPGEKRSKEKHFSLVSKVPEDVSWLLQRDLGFMRQVADSNIETLTSGLIKNRTVGIHQDYSTEKLLNYDPTSLD